MNLADRAHQHVTISHWSFIHHREDVASPQEDSIGDVLASEEELDLVVNTAR